MLVQGFCVSGWGLGKNGVYRCRVLGLRSKCFAFVEAVLTWGSGGYIEFRAYAGSGLSLGLIDFLAGFVPGSLGLTV